MKLEIGKMIVMIRKRREHSRRHRKERVRYTKKGINEGCVCRIN